MDQNENWLLLVNLKRSGSLDTVLSGCFIILDTLYQQMKFWGKRLVKILQYINQK